MQTYSLARNVKTMSIYAPLKFFIAFIVFTFILHLIGPWEYKDEETLPVTIFMLFAITFFATGYRSIAKKFDRSIVKNPQVCKKNFKRFVKVSKFALLLQLFLLLLLFYTSYANGRIELGAILDPGKIYIEALNLAKDDSESSFLVQVKTSASPLIYLGNIFLVYHYRSLTSMWRRLLVSTLGAQLLYGALVTGAQKGFFDLLILVSAVGVLRTYFNKMLFLKWAKYSAGFLVFAISVFCIFQISRMKAYDALDYSGAYRMSLDRDGLIFFLLGDSLGLAVSLFIGYLSQGYYGLSLSLQLPFDWTYGIGNSFALMSYFDQYFGIAGIVDKTYPFRMDAHFGWPAQMYWHTFFPWIASDITFPGAIVLMFFIGRIYARSYVESVRFDSPLAFCVFYLLSTLLIFLPANNQLMQTREMMVASSTLIISWFIFGRRYRRVR